MKLNRKIFLILLFIILFISVQSFVLGKYIKSTDTIKVADIDIKTFTFTLNDFSKYGKADVYINGSKVAEQVSSFNGTYNLGTTYEIKNIVANPGYTFVSSSTGNLTGTIGTDTPITLKFITTNYTISYNLNGGTISENKTNYTIETDNFTLPTPTKTGYTFAGWTGSNGTTKQTSITIKKGSTGNLSYTANWTANTYTIKFNSNTGSGSMSNLAMTYDTAKNLTPNSFTKTGYSFNSWNTKADATGTSYTDKQLVNNLVSNNGGSVTLYAIWKINQYKVQVLPVIDGTTYTNGKSGFTFSVYLNGILKSSNVTSYSQNVDYGTTVRIVSNDSSGYARENKDVTKTVETSNITFNPEWFKYTPISLKSYHEIYGEGDTSVSYSFDSSTGIYTVTQKAGTPGWGTGSLCDNTNITTSWGKTYVLHFEIYLDKNAKLYVDPNNRPI